MAQDTARTSRQRKPSGKAPKTAVEAAAKPHSRPATGRSATARSRAVATGDVADTRRPGSVQAGRVARATERQQTVAAMALSDVLRRHQAGDPQQPGSWLDELKALIGGAAPDEVAALRRLLFAGKPSRKAATARGPDPDAELSAHWRDGGYPYKNLMSRRSY